MVTRGNALNRSGTDRDSSANEAGFADHLLTTPYGEPVTALAELDALDSDEIVEGYHDGRANELAPKGNRSKAYWHGWRNGQADGHHMEIDPAMRELARQVIARASLPRPTPAGDA